MKNNVANQSIKRTPSPLLLDYCRDILDSYEVSVKPIISEDEALLEREDVELLARIVESNDRHHYLDERDCALLEQVLQMNLEVHIKNNDAFSEKSLNGSEIENKSEMIFIENLLLEEIWENEEVVAPQAVSDEDGIIAAFHDSTQQSTSYASCIPVRKTKSLILLHDFSRRSISCNTSAQSSKKGSTEALTNVGSTSGFGVSSENNSQTEVTKEKVDIIGAKKSKVHRGILEKNSHSQTSQTVGRSDSISFGGISDLSVVSGGAMLVPPPSMMSFAKEQSTKFDETDSIEIPSSTQSKSNIGDENLYTDQALKKMEEKLLQAINVKLNSKPSLPMTLSVKTINYFEVRRIQFEFYVFNIEYPIHSICVYHTSVAEGLCQEFEFKHLTFEELAQIGLFYKVEQNDEETCIKPMDVGEITSNPGSLLTMVKPTNTMLSEKLVNKIRNFYDSEKYSEIFEDAFELDLHSARSESDLEALLCTTKSFGPRVKGKDQEKMSQSLACKDSSDVGISGEVGVLYDNSHYDPQISSRSRKSGISHVASNSEVEDEFISGKILY